MKFSTYAMCLVSLNATTALPMDMIQKGIQGGVNWLSKQTDPRSYVVDPSNNDLFTRIETFIREKDINEILTTTTFEDDLFRVCKRESYAAYYIMAQIRAKNTDEVVAAHQANMGNIHPLMMNLMTKFLTTQGRTIHTALGQPVAEPATQPSLQDQLAANPLLAQLHTSVTRGEALLAAMHDEDTRTIVSLIKSNEKEQLLPPILVAAAKECLEKIQESLDGLQ